MRILTIAVCIVSLAAICQWTELYAADLPQVQAEIKLVGSKSLAHIIDLSGAQDGMAPQRTDLRQAISGDAAADNPNRPNRSRAN
jgi:hypothetical protein